MEPTIGPVPYAVAVAIGSSRLDGTTADTGSGAPGVAKGDLAELGWLLGSSFRSYLLLAEKAVSAVPFGFRGYMVLLAVSRWCPGSQLELGRRLAIDKTVMTHIIDSLESAGLVERRPGPEDRRARRVVLTSAGEEARCAAAQALATDEERLLQGMSPATRESLVEALTFLARRGGSGPECGEMSCSGSDDAVGSPCSSACTGAEWEC